MGQTAKLFKNGKSQAVRLPKAYRFEGSEVNIRRDQMSGEVILSPKIETLGDLMDHLDRLNVDIPEDFLSPEQRATPPHDRDPFADWKE